ncbi:hypothetical protein F0919_07845 [Taibaiella lutea]|uniref:Putative beta-lactamase-inhibitor-like PepSY-like domain-containing protein n=1 Tax=Taibaiella lutea TaxID=2608001 RepID=A0A5M6CH91_9BACT|nr:PepSY-like domain-containing protein [Taibaiella lutea]KAA5534524.1 hypothetical protein F0919_07845 [Taibaiella lutea]
MKKIIGMLGITLSLTLVIHAQEKKHAQVKPTQEAKAGFESKFPGATNVKWEKEDDMLEVNFKQGGKEMSALFETNGTLTETETEIAVTALPASASAYMKQHYAGKKVKEAAKIVKADGSVNYEAEVEKKDVLFDADGKFIKEAKD